MHSLHRPPEPQSRNPHFKWWGLPMQAQRRNPFWIKLTHLMIWKIWVWKTWNRYVSFHFFYIQKRESFFVSSFRAISCIFISEWYIYINMIIIIAFTWTSMGSTWGCFENWWTPFVIFRSSWAHCRTALCFRYADRSDYMGCIAPVLPTQDAHWEKTQIPNFKTAWRNIRFL